MSQDFWLQVDFMNHLPHASDYPISDISNFSKNHNEIRSPRCTTHDSCPRWQWQIGEMFKLIFFSYLDETLSSSSLHLQYSNRLMWNFWCKQPFVLLLVSTTPMVNLPPVCCWHCTGGGLWFAITGFFVDFRNNGNGANGIIRGPKEDYSWRILK